MFRISRKQNKLKILQQLMQLPMIFLFGILLEISFLVNFL